MWSVFLSQAIVVCICGNKLIFFISSCIDKDIDLCCMWELLMNKRKCWIIVDRRLRSKNHSLCLPYLYSFFDIHKLFNQLNASNLVFCEAYKNKTCSYHHICMCSARLVNVNYSFVSKDLAVAENFERWNSLKEFQCLLVFRNG